MLWNASSSMFVTRVGVRPRALVTLSPQLTNLSEVSIVKGEWAYQGVQGPQSLTCRRRTNPSQRERSAEEGARYEVPVEFSRWSHPLSVVGRFRLWGGSDSIVSCLTPVSEDGSLCHGVSESLFEIEELGNWRDCIMMVNHNVMQKRDQLTAGTGKPSWPGRRRALPCRRSWAFLLSHCGSGRMCSARADHLAGKTSARRHLRSIE